MRLEHLQSDNTSFGVVSWQHWQAIVFVVERVDLGKYSSTCISFVGIRGTYVSRVFLYNVWHAMPCLDISTQILDIFTDLKLEN